MRCGVVALMVAYATRRDVFRYGLPRGTLSSEGREVASCLASTDTLELESHGFETDDVVTVRAIQGGTLAAPLVAGTSYYVRRVTDSTFQLAATAGGASINLTTDGVTMIVSIPLPFDDVLEFYSRFVDGFLPAHAVPLKTPYDVTVVALVAELAAKKLQHLSGVSSVSMAEFELGAKAQLERYAAGLPLRSVASTQASTNLAVTATLGATSDPRGWGSGSLP
jgi:hypothetical protein